MKRENLTLSKYFYSNKNMFFILIISDIIAAISMVIWSLFMKGLADVAMKGNLSEIRNLILFGIFFLIFFFVVNNFQCYCNRNFIRKVNCQVKIDVFNAILSKDINDFNETNSGKYISILNNDINSIQENYFSNIPIIIENIITFLVATIALFVYEPLIAIVTLILACVPMIIPMIVGKKISDQQKKYFDFLEIYNTKIKDIFNGFEIVKSFNAENETKKLYKGSAYDVEDSRYDFKKSQDTSIIVQYTLNYLSGIIQLLFSIYLVLMGKITLGIFLGTMQISNYVTNPIRQASGQLVNLKSMKSIKLKIEQILNESNESNVKRQSLIKSTPIKIKNLNFGYDDKNLVLKNINFTFEKGKKYAIVGNSGSGKSTLVKLIMKYYEDYDGEIIIDKQNLKSIDKSDLCDKFAMIHQRVIIFDDTLKNNITMFKEYSNEDILEAINDSALQDLIESLPNGLDTKVQESGKNFSGGEQQRISIARAFLKNTSVIMLDEATSNLDNETGSKIENITIEKDNLTAIVVTHKLVKNILIKYDCIIALNHGEISEYGSFDELMNNKGYFYSLYTVNN
ncbi:MAG: ABC transporter ATP-binding protein [Clostridium argentinense]|uniref:ABC transporter ATP-binding protein n=1 Tax=uncultured Clostridium sp. TaxID=59620 RepID=UPI001DFC2CF0|nr:ABC transporter ATP-binding protein [uncultured Clostridium sp.]MBS5825127.1 ABC transporter ATP-binding protein [Clostridium argentinense]MDU1349471.1 ABC transporter ATP-binding protein [Clostridium argentinense]